MLNSFPPHNLHLVENLRLEVLAELEALLSYRHRLTLRHTEVAGVGPQVLAELRARESPEAAEVEQVQLQALEEPVVEAGQRPPWTHVPG